MFVLFFKKIICIKEKRGRVGALEFIDFEVRAGGGHLATEVGREGG